MVTLHTHSSQPANVFARAHGKSKGLGTFKHDIVTVTLLSGDFYVTGNPNEMLETILGSCIAACIRDTELGIGGMNHFLLPGSETPGNNLLDGSTRYGVYAMEQLINGILKLGGRKDRLEIKLFGGGNVIKNNMLIGSRNSTFAKEFLKKEGLSLKSADLEGTHPRRVHYFPTTGKVMVRHLKQNDEKRVMEEEKQFESALRSRPVEGDIELF